KRYISDKDYWRPRVKSFTENILADGLQDRAITRDLSWGVPVPIQGFEDKRIYVWFEAVIGYLSASKEWAMRSGDATAWEKYWKDSACKSYYFLGKDNIIFHTIIWPAILMGNGVLNLPYDVPANEFMNLGGQKFSKSAGVSIDLPDMLTKFQPDAIRYYLSVNMPELKDTEFDWNDFVAKVNNELVAAYGNFVHRVLSFTQKNFGEIPSTEKAPEDLKKDVKRQIDEALRAYIAALEACNFKLGLKAFMDLARYGNQFIDTSEPWALVRTDKEKCGGVLNLGLKIVRALSVMSYPYLPFSAEEIWKYLGYKDDIKDQGLRSLEKELLVGTKLSPPKPIFKKIELQITEEKEFSAIKKLNLKVGKIIEVRDHPKADKLYLMDVDIGRKITIVTGLKGIYDHEEIKQKRIIIVSNLEPATLRGVKSEGMLLAAEHGSTVSLIIAAEDVPAGTPVNSGYAQSEKRLSFQEFQKLHIVIGVFDGEKVNADGMFDCEKCDKMPKGTKMPFIIENGKALPLFCEDGTILMSDKEVPAGARIR
ncbi:MAG: class I tRNA ligase family protein, partial [Thermoplasmata archaeon]|nr:class I tRNA ligase family protein [Thermoplasmata archaeon]